MEDQKKDQIFEVVDKGDKNEMKTDAIREAKYAVENLKIENKISKHLKDYFDKNYGPNWHCIVGKNFYAKVSHESKRYMFFKEGPISILLYKLG